MLISCSNCQASYDVDAALIPATGREVKCASCGNNWVAMPIVEAPAKQEPKVEKTPAQLAAEAKALRAARREKRKQRQARQAALAKEKQATKSKDEQADVKKQAPAKVEAKKSATKADVSKVKSEKAQPKNAPAPKAEAEKFQAKPEKKTKDDTAKIKVVPTPQKVTKAVEKTAAKKVVKSVPKSTAKVAPKNKNTPVKTVEEKAKSTAEKSNVVGIKSTAVPKMAATSPENSTKTKSMTNSSALIKAFKKKQPVTQEEAAVAKAVEDLSVKAHAPTPEKKVAEKKTRAKAVVSEKVVAPTPNPTTPPKAKAITSTKRSAEVVQKRETKVAAPKSEPVKVKAETEIAEPMKAETAAMEKSAANFYGEPEKHDAVFLEREAQSFEFRDDDVKSHDAKHEGIKAEAKAVAEVASKQKIGEIEPYVKAQKANSGSRFWLGFSFAITFVLLMIAIRYMSANLANAMPFLAPYLKLFNFGFDASLQYVLGLLASLKAMIGM